MMVLGIMVVAVCTCAGKLLILLSVAVALLTVEVV